MPRTALAIVSTNPHFIATASEAVPRGVRCRAVSPDEFFAGAAQLQFWCAIVDPRACTPEFQSGLLALERTDPTLTIIVSASVGDPRRRPSIHPGGERGSVERRLDETVWPRMRGASIGALIGVVRRALLSAVAPGSTLHSAFEVAVTAKQPFVSVTQLAGDMGCDTHVLYDEWHASVPRSAEFSLGMVLDAILLLRILAEDHFDGDWKHTREAWKVGRGRGCRIAKRVLGQTYSDVSGSAFPVVVEWVRDTFAGIGRATGNRTEGLDIKPSLRDDSLN